jgi:hypothetical protein
MRENCGYNLEPAVRVSKPQEGACQGIAGVMPPRTGELESRTAHSSCRGGPATVFEQLMTIVAITVALAAKSRVRVLMSPLPVLLLFFAIGLRPVMILALLFP